MLGKAPRWLHFHQCRAVAAFEMGGSLLMLALCQEPEEPGRQIANRLWIELSRAAPAGGFCGMYGSVHGIHEIKKPLSG